MPNKPNTPDAPQSAKISDAPSIAGEQLQIAALVPDFSTISDADADAPSDALRNQWAAIVAEFDRNIEAFTAYVEDVREHIRRDNGWTGGTDHLRAFIRNGRFVTDKGTTFKVTHGHDAVWCREVCKRWPDVAPHILPTLRPSKFDVFYRRSIFSDEYVHALKQANEHPELLGKG